MLLDFGDGVEQRRLDGNFVHLATGVSSKGGIINGEEGGWKGRL